MKKKKKKWSIKRSRRKKHIYKKKKNSFQTIWQNQFGKTRQETVLLVCTADKQKKGLLKGCRIFSSDTPPPPPISPPPHPIPKILHAASNNYVVVSSRKFRRLRLCFGFGLQFFSFTLPTRVKKSALTRLPQQS